MHTHTWQTCTYILYIYAYVYTLFSISTTFQVDVSSHHAWVFRTICSLQVFRLHFVIISRIPMCATCPTHLILFDLIAMVVSCDEYKLWIASLWIFLHPPATSCELFTCTLKDDKQNCITPTRHGFESVARLAPCLTRFNCAGPYNHILRFSGLILFENLTSKCSSCGFRNTGCTKIFLPLNSIHVTQ
jgi:hypothetical protein